MPLSLKVKQRDQSIKRLCSNLSPALRAFSQGLQRCQAIVNLRLWHSECLDPKGTTEIDLAGNRRSYAADQPCLHSHPWMAAMAWRENSHKWGVADLWIDAVLVLRAGRADVAFLLAHEARRKLRAPCKETDVQAFGQTAATGPTRCITQGRWVFLQRLAADVTH
jgi:hypothetical protein